MIPWVLLTSPQEKDWEPLGTGMLTRDSSKWVSPSYKASKVSLFHLLRYKLHLNVTKLQEQKDKNVSLTNFPNSFRHSNKNYLQITNWNLWLNCKRNIEDQDWKRKYLTSENNCLNLLKGNRKDNIGYMVNYLMTIRNMEGISHYQLDKVNPLLFHSTKMNW